VWRTTGEAAGSMGVLGDAWWCMLQMHAAMSPCHAHWTRSHALRACWCCSSRECQLSAWRGGHKARCKELVKQAAAAKAAASGAGRKKTEPEPDEPAPIPTKVLYPYDKFLEYCKANDVCNKPPAGLANCGYAVLWCSIPAPALMPILAHQHVGACPHCLRLPPPCLPDQQTLIANLPCHPLPPRAGTRALPTRCCSACCTRGRLRASFSQATTRTRAASPAPAHGACCVSCRTWARR
jgi:hypothetical protein